MVKRKYLKGKNIALTFGTYAPFHVGHLSTVQQAETQHDSTLVVVSGYDGDRGDIKGLSLTKRFRYIREVFADDDLVVVAKLDENNIARYPNGWEDWIKSLDNLITQFSENRSEIESITVYTGEKDYQKMINILMPEWKVVLLDRTLIPISGTKIRENPIKYWNYITQPFHGFYSKKILIIGSASTGKTSLCKYLSKLLNAPISLEFAREYGETYNVADDELDVNDFANLLLGQFQQTSTLIDGKKNNGRIIADSNSTTTMGYIDYYLKDSISKEDYSMLKSLYLSIVLKEKWDKIFVTIPNVPYVDDGERDLILNEQQTRINFNNHLIDLLIEAGFENKITYLESEENVFYENYVKAIQVLKDELNINVGQR